MFYFGHGDIQDEIPQVAVQPDNTWAIVIGGLLILVGLILVARYFSLRPKSRKKK